MAIPLIASLNLPCDLIGGFVSASVHTQVSLGHCVSMKVPPKLLGKKEHPRCYAVRYHGALS